MARTDAGDMNALHTGTEDLGSPTKSAVTIIGLGPMGRAMARALRAKHHAVTVWNRTPARAAEVLSTGARLAATPAEALRASELVLLSLTDYQAMYDVLGASTDAL